MPEDNCQDNPKCPFKLLKVLFEALTSGKRLISWCGKEVKHYEKVESEAGRNLEDLK